MLCLVSWILICMLIYGKATRKWNVPSSERAKLDGGKIYVACLVAVAWSIPRLALSQLLFHPRFFQYCELIMDFGVVAYYVVLWQVYFFLWLRHRAIYAHPTVKGMMGRYSNCISWTMLVTLSLISVGVLCGFTIPHSYKTIGMGCVISENIDGVMAWNVSANLILGVFLVLSQGTFLSLFIYPMVITKKMRQQSFGSSTKSTPKRLSVRMKDKMKETVACVGENKCPTIRRLAGTKKESVDTISATLVRSVIGASVAVTSDLAVAFLAAFFIPGHIPRAITVTIYDLSLVISLLGIMGTFGANMNILLIFCKKTKNVRPASTDSNRSRTMSTEIFDWSHIGCGLLIEFGLKYRRYKAAWSEVSRWSPSLRSIRCPPDLCTAAHASRMERAKVHGSIIFNQSAFFQNSNLHLMMHIAQS